MSNDERRQPEGIDSVPPTTYDRRYFHSSCEGYQDFRASGGRKLGARFRKALKLAQARPGERVLDVGCGRGELVLQSALRGAYAVGVDYAADAVTMTAEALSVSPFEVRKRAAVLRMNARHLAFPDASFDLAFMSDIVEHLHPPELREVLSETARVLRPDGRLIVHTCPNRLLYDYTYKVYVRHIHRWFRRLAELTRYRSFTIGPMLATGPEHPRTPTERQVHVNEQTPRSLRTALEGAGLRVTKTLYWEMPKQLPYVSRLLTAELMVLDSFRYLRPTSFAWPLNRLFANHIWMIARKP
jgi:ubiquinone/menaquinone biosynthesis C-methylase UbiE